MIGHVRLMVAAIVLVTAATAAHAGIAQIAEFGNCANGNKWITITNIDDGTGRIIGMWGTNCAGETWVGHCSIVTVPDNPGMASDYVYNGTGYWVRYNVNAAGDVTSAWGRGVDGTYWMLDVPNLL
ncbi:MAG: hypothetical protein JWQ98_662 [Chlorobi bacterium]|nr:hypothetical protein [Chlorobiota bacterium]